MALNSEVEEENYLFHDDMVKKKAWIQLKEAFENNTTITGRIIEKKDGGFSVNVGSLIAFLPNSLVVESPVCDDFIFDYSISKFKIIEMDSKGIVVSQHSLERETFFKTVKEDSVITGKVTSIKGVHTVLDLGGVNASLCIDGVKIGEEIKISILSIDAKTQKVRIKKAGIQQIDELWQDVLSRYPVGMIFIGTVITKVDYGCFVEIEKGIDGLLHISEMINIDSIKADDKVKLMVFKIDELNRKISLSEIRIPM